MLYGKRRAALYLTNYISRVEMKKLMAKIPEYLKRNGMEDCTVEIYIKPGLRKYQESMNNNAVKALKAINPDYDENGEKIVEVKTLNVLIAEANAGFTDVVFFGYNSKFESDAMRYNSMSTERKEQNDTVDRKNEILHYTDQLIQHIDYHDTVDKFLYWVLPQFKREIDFVHVDTAYSNYTLYSVSEEFYKPVEHFKNISPKVEAWSKALAYTRRQAIAFLMWANSKKLSEEDLYAYANGVAKNRTGATPDAQIVKCPDCGLPTRASAASVGTVDSEGKYIPEYAGAKQMTCENCGGDLSSCFDIDYSIKDRGYSFRKQNETVDVFETIASLTTEINDRRIDPLYIKARATVMNRLENYFESMKKEHATKKNNVPEHTYEHHCNSSIDSDYRAEEHPLVGNKQRRIQPLTAEQKARAERWSKPIAVKSERAASSSGKTAPGATIAEIRAMQR